MCTFHRPQTKCDISCLPGAALSRPANFTLVRHGGSTYDTPVRSLIETLAKSPDNGHEALSLRRFEGEPSTVEIHLRAVALCSREKSAALHHCKSIINQVASWSPSLSKKLLNLPSPEDTPTIRTVRYCRDKFNTPIIRMILSQKVLIWKCISLSI